MTNYTHPEVRFAEESGDADTVDNEDAADIVTKPRVDAVNADADTLDGHDTPLPTTAIGALSGSPVPSSDLDLSDLVTAIAGDNVTADTTNNELDTSGGSANVPNWQEDPNSPVQVSSSASGSITLSGEYDEVMVRYGDFSYNGILEELEMQVNGDTGTNYEYFSVDGTTTTGGTAWPVAAMQDNDQQPNGITIISGRWNEGAVVGNNTGAFNGEVVQTGANVALTSPLDSITWQSSGGTSFSGTIEVFGRDV